MVQKGLYSVELIDAETKEPFLEHEGRVEASDDNCVDSFVEIEPGSEYFLRVANDSSNSVICNITVDGADLGYEFCLGPNEYDDKGLWKLENGTSQHTALKVHKVISSARSDTDSDPKSEIGIINVDFFEYVEGEGTEMAKDFQSEWSSDDKCLIAGGDNNTVDDTKRKVKSQVGSHSEVLSNDDGKRNVYSYGDDLETIRLKYCTAVGLIVEGVLLKPPLWEWARLTHGNSGKENDGALNIEPKVMTFQTQDGDGNVVEVKHVDMFDLTAVDE